jgi:single-strand DNA-binding protein
MSFSKITIIGNLGKDPELRYTPQGDAVCDFSVAVNDRKRDKAGEWQDITTWFRVTFWRKQAENASKYLTKGRQVYVEGRLQLEEWTDRDGNNRQTLAIQGSELQFIGDRSVDERASNSTSESDNNFADNISPQKADKITNDSSSAPTDDDIPF